MYNLFGIVKQFIFGFEEFSEEKTENCIREERRRRIQEFLKEERRTLDESVAYREAIYRHYFRDDLCLGSYKPVSLRGKI